jgi:hypothetical protein
MASAGRRRRTWHATRGWGALVREKIDSADAQGRKTYLRSVISYVEVDDDKVRIVGDKATLAAVAVVLIVDITDYCCESGIKNTTRKRKRSESLDIGNLMTPLSRSLTCRTKLANHHLGSPVLVHFAIGTSAKCATAGG